MKAIETLSTDEERAAEVFRALGNPARLRIVVELARRNACATDLLGVLPLAAPTVSRHLKVLKDAKVIQGTIEDNLCYCIDPVTIRWLVEFCGDLLPPGLLSLALPLVEGSGQGAACKPGCCGQ